MKQLTCALLLTFFVGLSSFSPAAAQTARPLNTPSSATPILAEESPSVATDEGQVATDAAIIATPQPEIKPNDLTNTTSVEKDKYTAFLEANPIGELSWHNFLQHPIRQAISQGLPANIVILLLLFPVIASIIAASRHLVGLQGFGIYIPAVLSVAFVSTGIGTGIVMFVVVLLAATIFRAVIKIFKLQYLPRTALLLWGVSLSVLALLISTTIYGFGSLITVTIFPLLIIMLLTENFMETQLTSSQSQALQLTFETSIVAVLCSVIISLEVIQQFVLLWPELTLLSVAAFNLAVGRYSGLRLFEYLRFRSILEG